jgi:hypothetical protein
MCGDSKVKMCRKEYFRQYYQANKNKYIKENRPDMQPKKRGRPKKVIPPFTISTGEFIIKFD